MLPEKDRELTIAITECGELEVDLPGCRLDDRLEDLIATLGPRDDLENPHQVDPTALGLPVTMRRVLRAAAEPPPGQGPRSPLGRRAGR